MWFENILPKELSQTPDHCDPNFLNHTRIHSLNEQHSERAKVWVKRDEENGFILSGTKRWKYASLLPFLKKHNYEQAVVIGGARSNNVAAACAILTEKKIKPFIFAKESHSPSSGGNEIFSRWLLSPDQFHWITKSNWKIVDQLADGFANYEDTEGRKTFIIPEGAGCAPSIWGTIMLFASVMKNEQENNISFDHIFMDAGTAFTACVFSFAHQISKHTSQLHIVPVAGDESFVQNQMIKFKDLFSDETKINFQTGEYEVHPLTEDVSFGSTSSSLFEWMIQFGRTEGILTEPVYTAKFFRESLNIIPTKNLKGNILLIHSGGLPTLGGFSENISAKSG